jgi:amino acid transporter
MASSNEIYVWIAVAVVLMVFAVPWFMWGSDAVAFGLPVWVWWHVGWMVLASAVFWVFTGRGWGLGIEEVSGRG